MVWRRAYRLALGGRPVFAIREWFLRPVLDALADLETGGRRAAAVLDALSLPAGSKAVPTAAQV